MKTKQTNWIKIENKGEIDLGGLHLMGVSSKREDEEKIGFFGSGNKYAIALMLREKIPFKIYSGTQEVKIDCVPVFFRGQLHNQIRINKEKTSLTSSMGIDWEPWFAVREMYCNAVDEGGEKITMVQELDPEKGKTSVYIALDEKLEVFFRNFQKYILTEKKDRHIKEKTCYGDVEVYPSNGEELVCYRKGIRIFPKNSTKSLFWYNFSKIEINESRTYKYEHEVLERIASVFAVTNNQIIIKNYLQNWKHFYESEAKWEYVSDKLSPAWHEILRGQRVYPVNLAIETGDYEGKANSFIVPDKLAKKISEEIKDAEVVGYTKGKEFLVLEMTENEKVKVDTAFQELKRIGYDITCKFVLAEAKVGDVIAWYDKETNTIYHTRKHLNSISELKNTLLEEHFHSLGLEDGQRTFVTFLIDEIIKAKTI